MKFELFAASAVGALIVLPVSVVAQTVATAPAAPTTIAAADEVPDEAIIVTGSRIRSANIESQVPVTVLLASDVLGSGSVSIGDVLNNLPALRSTFSTANSTQFIGTTGLNILDLRGLGTARTLVLQNGKRHVSSREGQQAVDVNTIPTALLDRVEVVTGGASSIYGSDAIAGVVNFVLKNNYTGVAFTAQSGISSRGDRPATSASVTAGTNFSEGRGNIAASAEFAKNNSLSVRDREGTRVRRQLSQIEFDPAGSNSDGIPDRLFFNDVRSVLLSKGGTFVPVINTANPATFLSRTNPDGSVVRVPRIYRVNQDGTVSEANYGTRDFRFGQTSAGVFNTIGPTNTLGGDGETLRDYGLLQPEVSRYAFNALGHYEFSPAFIPYFEAKYVRVDSVQESSPTFGQGGAARGSVANANFLAATTDLSPTNSLGIPIRFDNPFLNPQAATFLRTITTAGDGYFRVNRNNVDLGSRGEIGRRETYRGVVGVRGTFNDDWSYDVSANYGDVRNHIASTNNRIQQRFELAVDAVRDPASGQIVCRSRLTPPAPLAVASANGSPLPVNVAKNAQLANDIAQCVPINVLGNGSPSRAALAYVNATTQYAGYASQFDVSGFISGDLSQLFSLPGGPIGFAIGGEYRRETSGSSYGSTVSSGLTFLNAIPDFRPLAQEVKEGFAEVNVPLIKDVTLLNELTLKAAARYSDYNNRTGGVFAYNGGVIYSPFKGLRFRGNYSVAVRAPTQSDLFAAPSQNFANVNDPCDAQFINSGSATRVANCAAAGIPAGFNNAPARASSTELLSRGNDQLIEERSRSLTVGAVAQPRFLPGVTLSLDYYRIEIKNVIQAVAAQTALNLCYDAPTLTNAFCPTIRRDASGFFQRPGIVTQSFNYAKRIAEGVDFDGTYNFNLGRYGAFNNRATLTWVRRRDNYPVITDQTFRDQILNELGDPEWAFNYSTDWKLDKLTIGYRLRYLDKMYVNTIEDIIPINGAPAQNPDYSSPLFYPETFYHDFRVSFDATKRFQVYGGVDNAFDKAPPLGLTGTGDGSGIYDNVGRFLYVGVTARF